jgi:hypothetical protein
MKAWPATNHIDRPDEQLAVETDCGRHTFGTVVMERTKSP